MSWYLGMFDKETEGDTMPDNNILKLPVDSEVSVTIVSNGSEAYITVEPPVNGGADITAAAIMRKLSEAGVTYGINEEALNKIADTTDSE